MMWLALLYLCGLLTERIAERTLAVTSVMQVQLARATVSAQYRAYFLVLADCKLQALL